MLAGLNSRGGKLQNAVSILIEKLETRALFSVGGLDPSFGAGGMVRTHFGDYSVSRANDVAILPDGKILSVGTARRTLGDYGGDFAITRLNRNGSPDDTF